MVRWGLTAMAFVTTLALLGGVSAASGNEPPLADAGLDQTVDNGTTVYLDAGGSVDPDGTIASIQWSITDPGGNDVTAADDSSVRTHFTPTQTGDYIVNLSVVDDDGATSEDTLYVTVEDPDRPAVTLTGPSQATKDEQTEFTVTTTAGDAELRQLHWFENDSKEQTFDLSGDESEVSLTRSFTETKTYRLEATVMDTKGYAQTSSLHVQVVPSGGRVGPSGGSAGDYEHCPGSGSPYFVNGEFQGCNDGGADMIYEDRVLEANGRSGLWLSNGGSGVVQMVSENQLEDYKDHPSDTLTRSEVRSIFEDKSRKMIENHISELRGGFSVPTTSSSGDDDEDVGNDETISTGDNGNTPRKRSANDRTVSGRTSNIGGSCVAPCNG